MLKRRRENEELKRGTLGLAQWVKNTSEKVLILLSTCIFTRKVFVEIVLYGYSKNLLKCMCNEDATSNRILTHCALCGDDT